MSKNVVLLNSRQGLFPSGSLNWVKKTIEAVKWVKENDLILLSSVGMNSWELVTNLAAVNKIRLKLFIPHDSHQNFEELVAYYKDQFQLSEKIVEYLPVTLLYEEISKEQLLKARDRKIMEHADLVIPVSLRKTSGWYAYLKNNIAYPNIVTKFETSYSTHQPKQAYRIEPDELNSELNNLGDDYLFHYTRQPAHPWPDERLFDYYQAISKSLSYPRTALATLDKIIGDNNIIASSKNILQNNPVVSFSASNPTQMTDLIRWRKRYHQMSFEPYAIGINKKQAVVKKILPVIYYDLEDQKQIDPAASWRYQSKGKMTDWTNENEYRHPGDFDFSTIDKNDLLLLTRFKEEAEQLQKKTGIRSLPFTIY